MAVSLRDISVSDLYSKANKCNFYYIHIHVAVPQLEDAEPQPEVEGTAPKSPAVVFNITGDAVEHGMDGNDDDMY